MMNLQSFIIYIGKFLADKNILTKKYFMCYNKFLFALIFFIIINQMILNQYLLNFIKFIYIHSKYC